MGCMPRPAVVLAGLLLSLCGSLALAQAPAEASLAELIGEYEALIRKDDPVSAGQEGDREALRRLPDVRPETQQAFARQLQSISERLAAIDASALSDEAALNHQLLTSVVATHSEQLGYDLPRMPFVNDSGFHTLLDYLARTTTIGSRDDASRTSPT
jgi:uncharacterized protein (DUF885 family)